MLSRPSTPVVDRAAASTIVVVEDDPDMSGMLSKALATSGYRVLVAATGDDARTLFEQIQPDLILLDLMLPDIDGLSLTTSFQRLTGAPIVVCSARQGQVDRVLSLKLGAADFVSKPFELDELLARVGAALRRSRKPSMAPPRDEIQLWRESHHPKGAKNGTGRATT
jgi:two-component system, OmpR family, response regulator AdeR